MSIVKIVKEIATEKLFISKELIVDSEEWFENELTMHLFA
jgi:hypothetical protein